MSNLLKILYVSFLAVSFVAVAAFAQGNDVYNFYFQKAAGPTTVIQGGGAQQPQPTAIIKDGEVVQTSPIAAQPTPVVMAQNSTASTDQANQNRTWAIYGGMGSIVSNPSPSEYVNARGVSLGATYNFSKYFGVGGAATYSSKIEFEHSEVRRRTSPWDFSLQAVVTPIHMQLFGYDFISMGLVGGFMTGSEKITKTAIDVDESKRLVAFLGPRVVLNINPAVGLVGEWRFQAGETDEKNSQFTGGMMVRF